MNEEIVDAIEVFQARRDENGGKPIITDGFSREMPDLTGVEYFSAQRVKELVISCQHFDWKYNKGHKEKETPAKKLGKLTHWALLQPKVFLSRYIIRPEFEGKGSRDAARKWESELKSDAIVLTAAQAVKVSEMIKALYAHPRASKLLARGTPEVHTFFTDHEHRDELGQALLWFGIMDFFRSGNWIVEVKTTKNAEWRSFKRDCYEYGYHLQVWLYRRMVRAITGQDPRVALIAVENVEPYCVQIFEPDQMMYDHANFEVIKALEEYRECRLSGFWPAYSKDTVALGGPERYQSGRFDEEGDDAE